MAPTAPLVTSTTRRTIVTTGAKLAYAAPLVAVSLKLSGVDAQTAMSPPPKCTSFGRCGGELSLGCVYLCSTENEQFCAAGINLQFCDSDADCQEGRCERSDEGGGLALVAVQSPTAPDCRAGLCWPDPFSGGRGRCRGLC